MILLLTLGFIYLQIVAPVTTVQVTGAAVAFLIINVAGIVMAFKKAEGSIYKTISNEKEALTADITAVKLALKKEESITHERYLKHEAELIRIEQQFSKRLETGIAEISKNQNTVSETVHDMDAKFQLHLGRHEGMEKTLENIEVKLDKITEIALRPR